MTVTGPDFIALQVRDLARSAEFYEEHLGMRRAPAGPPGAVVFATSPIAFAVREPLRGISIDEIAPWPGAGVALWLRTENARDLHDDLVRAGVPIVTPPAPGPFGTMFALRDPDGYLITIH